MARKPIFKKAEREAAMQRFRDHLKAVWNIDAELWESSDKAIRLCRSIKVPTKHGLMRISFDISPTFAHVYRQFEQKPGDDLPWQTALNPYSFKWNKWTTPHEHPQEFLDLLFKDIEREHKLILS